MLNKINQYNYDHIDIPGLLSTSNVTSTSISGLCSNLTLCRGDQSTQLSDVKLGTCVYEHLGQECATVHGVRTSYYRRIGSGQILCHVH